MTIKEFLSLLPRPWRDIKEYIDSRIQYSKILLSRSLLSILNESIDTLNKKKQDKLKAGENITIKKNVISAKSKSYTAGQNIDISNNVISAKGYRYNEGVSSFAEGTSTTASGFCSHAEGNSTTASGSYSHAEGQGTTSSGYYSHAEGSYTVANNFSEHAEGSYNSSHKTSGTYGDAGNTQHSVGIGKGENNRKNAFEIMQNGDVYVKGIGTYDGTNPSSANSLQDVINNIIDAAIVDLTAGSSVTQALDPNKLYMFGEKTDITITLNAGSSGVVNEYMFQFTSGNVATTLNVPNTVVWLKEPDIQTNKIYQVSIENNLGIIGEWNNE